MIKTLFLLANILLPTLLLMSSSAYAETPTNCSVKLDPYQLSAQENFYFYIDQYLSPEKEQLVLFSAHNSTVDDNQLKRLWRELERGLTEHRRNRITLQVRARVKRSLDDLKRDQMLLNFIKEEHNKKPFLYFAAEFSKEKAHRFEKRIEVTNFVARELVAQTELSKEEVDSYILLLTGEDVFALLEGQFLAHLPLYPTEVQSEMNDSAKALGSCFAIMGGLEFSQKPEALKLVKKITTFYRPRPDQREEYLMAKEEIIQALESDGLLRLRAGIMKKEEIPKAVSDCDALFNLKRDQTVAQRMHSFPLGRGLITRGTGHRYLLKETFLNNCQL